MCVCKGYWGQLIRPIHAEMQFLTHGTSSDRSIDLPNLSAHTASQKCLTASVAAVCVCVCVCLGVFVHGRKTLREVKSVCMCGEV